MAMIEAKNLRKIFRGNHGLRDFSLSIAAGELVGLVGPNGAGKTTLIKIISTLLPADSGSTIVCGYSVSAEPQAVRASTGYLADFPGVYQDMRVEEFLQFFADAFRLREPQRSASMQRAIERSGLQDRQNDFVEHLSLGWKQRLLLAKTLLHEPKILLLDEPATGLDPLARIALREQLQQLHAEGITILISSHILSDLEDICTRIVFIADGKNVSEPSTASKTEQAALPVIRCEIEFVAPLSAVHAAISRAKGKLLSGKKGNQLIVELPGGAEEASAFLQDLLASKVLVIHFDARGPGLEERYRRTFEERPS
jgi:ABC-2 type transport system ATP-binding protein